MANALSGGVWGTCKGTPLQVAKQARYLAAQQNEGFHNIQHLFLNPTLRERSEQDVAKYEIFFCERNILH